jgi:hypothetical protein
MVAISETEPHRGKLAEEEQVLPVVYYGEDGANGSRWV